MIQGAVWLAAVDPVREAASRLLATYPPTLLARGRAYAREGRVAAVHVDDDAAYAIVEGTYPYEVTIGADDGTGDAVCSCPAYDRVGECKHVAALAVALTEASPAKAEKNALPPVFRSVYSTATFLIRLALHAGKRIDARVEAWLPLADFWQFSFARTLPRQVEVRELVSAHAAEVAQDLAALAAWEPPPAPLPGTAYGALYARLADRYRAARAQACIYRAAPGPLRGDRHPGFDFVYNAKKSTLVAGERPTPLHDAAFALTIRIPGDPGQAPENDDDGPRSNDAWDLFARRALLLALCERTVPAMKALERDLGRSIWEHVLDRLAADADAEKVAEPREWTFSVAPGYSGDFELLAFARISRETKQGKWRKQGFAALLREEVSPLERKVARVAIASIERLTGRARKTERCGEMRFEIGTAQGHDLLRLLAQHPRVVFSAGGAPDPECDPPARIFADDLVMRIEQAPNGSLVPRFVIDDHEVSASSLVPAEGPFRGAARGATLASAFVPPAIQRWLAAAQAMGEAFAFPPEAAGKLAATIEPLVAAGVAELPREALGAELPYEPRPALRVEWLVHGAAVVELLIAAHPHAPLVAAGAGARLFTFEHAGRRVFVERDLDGEHALLLAARGEIAAPLAWDGDTGGTDSLEDALALADYLDRNPLGLPIEVKIGRPPSVIAWSEANRAIEVRPKGAWLMLDGDLGGGRVKLTLGDVLEAARHARRYVKAGDGAFVELSKEALCRLRPVAVAAELAGGPEPRIHAAFGALLAGACDLFRETRGADLDLYAKRFAARDRRIRVPALEHGALRPYQREGARWMLGLATWAPGCVLADDMGLGKTVQTAGVLKARAKLGPALVVAPASVSSNWVAELARFMPSLRVRWYNEDRGAAPAKLGPNDVLVVSYGLLQRRADVFKEQRWSTVVVDEAQYVKNLGAQRTDAIRALERDFTIALTGTPLENHLGELYSIVDLVFPGLLGDEASFRECFRKPIEGGRDRDRLSALSELLTPFLLRRTRTAVLEELPPREDIVEYVELGDAERKRYLALRRACEEQFGKRQKGETPAQLKIALLAALTRLRQLACDVRLVDPTFKGGSAKIARAVELAQQLAEEGNRALFFSQFTQFLEKVRTALSAAGLRVAFLSGDTPTAKRRAIVDSFQAGDYDVFCVSLLAGGTGLNLTRASYVVHLDPWWNPAAEEQATSRSHRMGQTSPVTVYRLVSRGTIEEAVLDMHEAKRDLADAVLAGKGDAKAVSPDQLIELLRFGA